MPDFYSEDGMTVVKAAFRRYCAEGGFPKAVLTENESARIKILQSYFNTMLFRDLIEHYDIKSSPSVVRYFLKRVFENTTKPTSVNNIYNELKSAGMKVGKDSLYEWLEYACNIFLLYKLPCCTRSVLKESALPSKYYAADNGLRRAVLGTQSFDDGKSLETIVFAMLHDSLGSEDKLYYFREDSGECDFVVRRSGRVEELIQVCWELTKENRTREVDGLLAVSGATGCRNCRIITFEQEETIIENGLTITVVPAWRM